MIQGGTPVCSNLFDLCHLHHQHFHSLVNNLRQGAIVNMIRDEVNSSKEKIFYAAPRSVTVPLTLCTKPGASNNMICIGIMHTIGHTCLTQ